MEGAEVQREAGVLAPVYHEECMRSREEMEGLAPDVFADYVYSGVGEQ